MVEDGRYFLQPKCSAEWELCRAPKILSPRRRSLETPGSGRKCVPMHAPVDCSPTGSDVAGAASLGIRGKRVAWRGLTYPGLQPRQRNRAGLCRKFPGSHDYYFEGWSRASSNTWLLGGSFSLEAMFHRWWRSELLHPFVDAGASPAGFSRAVVQLNRTTNLYTRIECSPCETWFQRCCATESTRETRHGASLHNANIAGGEDSGYLAGSRLEVLRASRSGFRLRAQTPAKRLKFESCRRSPAARLKRWA